MNESESILHAFDQLCVNGRPAALATVVRVSGSSYRRPGARMLIAGDGRTWGGVSGGCLERDVSRQGRIAIETGQAVIHRYDTSDDFGTGTALGCAGIIDILIERVQAFTAEPFAAMRSAVWEKRPSVLGTVIRSSEDSRPIGTRYGLSQSLPLDIRNILETAATRDAAGIFDIEKGEIFVEILKPPQSVVLFGGGPDVVPVVDFAKTLGWHVTVVASHAVIGFRDRFLHADKVAVGTEDDPLGGVKISPESAVVLMTHNYARDLQLLPLLLQKSLAYLGILGPRRRAERLVLETPHLPSDVMSQLHAPVGLDIGAESPQAIALAIVSEIQAVLAQRPCHSLRDRSGPIYAGDSDLTAMDYHPVSCPISA